MEEFGIYVHIPFCKSKCFYCDFISFSNKEDFFKDYIEALKNEIEYNSKFLKDKNITTIYIGGGTPSIINEEFVFEIVSLIKEKYNVSSNAEITIEANPGTINREKFVKYREAGINRISIGLQSTKDNLLKSIGRIHTYNQFLECYKLAREVGFENINIDLMLALPKQTLEDLNDSIDEVIKLNPEHISVYSLILEEGTKLEEMLNENKIELIDDELERKMYWNVKEKLENNGYTHYEISNFAKKGYESKHNMNCWNQQEYLGLGLAAHSYINNKRYSNIDNIEKYIKNIKENHIENNYIVHEEQNIKEKQKEYMMLGLRKIEGVSIQEFKNRFIDNPIYVFHNELEELVKEELIEIDLDNIKLTKKGIDLANQAWEKFV